jgi:hypothetical protein
LSQKSSWQVNEDIKRVACLFPEAASDTAITAHVLLQIKYCLAQMLIITHATLDHCAGHVDSVTT